MGEYVPAQVQWHHAVNSRQRLITVLVECQSHPETPCMVEADVSRGQVVVAVQPAPGSPPSFLPKGGAGSSKEPPVAIMAHPPDTKGDMSFAEFVDLIAEHVKGRVGYHQTLENGEERAPHGLLGIKLDFKTPLVLHPCLKYLKQKIRYLNPPQIPPKYGHWIPGYGTWNNMCMCLCVCVCQAKEIQVAG